MFTGRGDSFSGTNTSVMVQPVGGITVSIRASPLRVLADGLLRAPYSRQLRTYQSCAATRVEDTGRPRDKRGTEPRIRKLGERLSLADQLRQDFGDPQPQTHAESSECAVHGYIQRGRSPRHQP